MLRSTARLGTTARTAPRLLNDLYKSSLCLQCNLRTISSSPILLKKKKSAAAKAAKALKAVTATPAKKKAASKNALKNSSEPKSMEEYMKGVLASAEANMSAAMSNLEQQAAQSPVGMSMKAAMTAPKKVKTASGKVIDTLVVNADENDVEMVQVPDQPEVRGLCHGLDRVLFNPGVFFLQDPRSRVYNFEPYLQKVLPVTDFDFDTISQYITSSKDQNLHKMTVEKGKKYMGSTSSMTGALSHFHYLISKWRPLNFDVISRGFMDRGSMGGFTNITRAPSAIFLRYKGDGTYAIDADKEFDLTNILSLLGHSMERLLTMEPEEFAKHTKEHSHLMEPEKKGLPETYHYSTFGDFMMRSQLDAQDKRLPGRGVFDLKSRAVASIRTDVHNFEHGIGYQIKGRTGSWESYEREYYDLIRSAFLKYSLQVRMGAMDGIFVTYHNIMKIFGFQYISIDEMDTAIHGGPNIGGKEFRLSLMMLNDLLNRATQKYPEQSLRIFVETRETVEPMMYFFAEPMEEEEILAIQRSEADEVKKFMEILKQKLGANKDWRGAIEEPEAPEEEAEAATEETDAVAEETDAVAEQTEAAAEQTEAAAEEAVSETPAEQPTAPAPAPAQPVFASEQPIGEVTDLNSLFPEDVTIEEAERLYTTFRAEKEDDIAELADSTNADALSISEQALDPASPTTTTTTPSDDPTDLANTPTDPPEGPISHAPEPDHPPKSVLGFSITIENQVNGHKCQRPYDLKPEDEWKMRYEIKELAKPHDKYKACKMRRQKMYDNDDGKKAQSAYLRNLRELAEEGRRWEEERERLYGHEEKVVVN